jgi:hypothetical protein
VRNFFKHLWLRRWFRGCVWFTVTLFTVLILVRQYVGWSGARRWAEVRQMLAQEGESLDFREIAPDAVPDEENFCAIPPLKDLASSSGQKDDKSDLNLKFIRLVKAALPDSDSKAGPRPKFLQGASLGKATDMKALADWFRKEGSLPAPPDSGNPAGDVLAALSGKDGLVSELALGLSRPESQWTPAWKTRVLTEPLYNTPLPYYSVAKGLITMLCLRSAAAARAGDAAQAQESVLIALRINQAYVREPFLIGTLVACAGSTVISGAAWELCDTHSGTAEDFRALQEALSKFDYRASYLYARRSELADNTDAIAYMERTRDLSLLQQINFGPSQNGIASAALRIIPDGWFDGNLAAIAGWNFDYGIKPLRDAGFPELLAKQKELEALLIEQMSELYRHPGESLALIAVPSLTAANSRVVYAQSIVNETIAACALERYRIEHNSYPDTLEAANRPGEKSIPLDILSGNPMGYRKTADGRYALWCVSFDGVDHRGQRVLDQQQPENTKFADPKYSGDWVWDFPNGTN